MPAPPLRHSRSPRWCVGGSGFGVGGSGFGVGERQRILVEELDPAHREAGPVPVEGHFEQRPRRDHPQVRPLFREVARQLHRVRRALDLVQKQEGRRLGRVGVLEEEDRLERPREGQAPVEDPPAPSGRGATRGSPRAARGVRFLRLFVGRGSRRSAGALRARRNARFTPGCQGSAVPPPTPAGRRRRARSRRSGAASPGPARGGSSSSSRPRCRSRSRRTAARRRNR